MEIQRVDFCLVLLVRSCEVMLVYIVFQKKLRFVLNFT
jgi:hypothetical protein